MNSNLSLDLYGKNKYDEAPFYKRREQERADEIAKIAQQIQDQAVGLVKGPCDYCHREFIPCFCDIVTLKRKCVICLAEEKYERDHLKEKLNEIPNKNRPYRIDTGSRSWTGGDLDLFCGN